MRGVGTGMGLGWSFRWKWELPYQAPFGMGVSKPALRQAQGERNLKKGLIHASPSA